ncbi:MAG: Ig-like domain-containing protein, partial [Hyphomicrobiaceae bacterium]|nr:Ig-like domain-containing protein [Hyphomicrobiaceae bacterium]
SSFTVTVVDTTAPVIVSLTPGNTDTTSDTTPTISADFSENGSGVNVSNIVFSFSGNKEYADEYAVKSADGVVYEQVAPLIAGTYEAAVTAVDNAGNSATKTWSFIVNPTVTTIAVSSDEWSTYADGVSEIKITAEVRDEMGNPIISGTVNFVASPIGDLSDSISSLDENGLATTILTSSEVGNSTVTAYYDAPSGPINGSTYVYFNETPKAISVTATPDNVPANGSTESIITATISDNGDSIVGGTVNFTTDLGTLSFDNAISDVNGQAAVTLTSTTNSSATVTVSYNTGSGTINDQTNVEFTEYDNTPPTATQYPVDNLTNVAITINPYIDFSEAM